MKQEDYCSFEVAKLLKEKGFNEYCPLWYNLDKPTDGPLFYKEIGWYGHNSYDYIGKRIVSAPTHQMALKWLREVHNIHISVQPDYPSKTNYKLSWCWSVNMLHKDCFECKKHQSYIDTFEQAVGAAILYVLKNLI